MSDPLHASCPELIKHALPPRKIHYAVDPLWSHALQLPSSKFPFCMSVYLMHKPAVCAAEVTLGVEY